MVRFVHIYICDECQAEKRTPAYNYYRGDDAMRPSIAPMGWTEAQGRIYCELHKVTVAVKVERASCS